MSSVWLTTPSVEFSTGTTPKSAPPRTTSSNTPAIVPTGTVRADSPNWRFTAMWVKVASGPRYATRTVFSSDRQALKISWKTGRIASLGNGPAFTPISRSVIWRSRDGT